MNPRQIISQLRTTLAVLDRLGGELPKTTATALEDAMALADRVRDWQRTLDAQTPSAAVVAALLDGRDPLDDPAVARAVIAAKVTDVLPGIDDNTGARLAAVAREHISDLIHAFDKPYTEAAQKISAAHHVLSPLGITHESDPGAVLSRGVAATNAWADVVNATDVVIKIQSAIKPLLVVLGTPASAPLAYFVDTTGRETVEFRRMGRSPQPLAIVEAGMTLSLAGPDEAAQRVMDMATESDRRDRVAADRAADAARRPSYI